MIVKDYDTYCLLKGDTVKNQVSAQNKDLNFHTYHHANIKFVNLKHIQCISSYFARTYFAIKPYFAPFLGLRNRKIRENSRISGIMTRKVNIRFLFFVGVIMKTQIAKISVTFCGSCISRSLDYFLYTRFEI